MIGLFAICLFIGLVCIVAMYIYFAWPVPTDPATAQLSWISANLVVRFDCRVVGIGRNRRSWIVRLITEKLDEHLD